MAPAGVFLSALRRKSGSGFELRVVEAQGQEASAVVDLGIPVAEAVETDLLGAKVGDVGRVGGRLEFKIQPWKFRTFGISG